MFVFIFTTIVVGFACAGIIMLGFRLTGRKAPKYLIPLTAALGMFGYMIWDDYSWFDRISARLPDNVIVTETFTANTPYKPWTLINPPIDRFTAIDAGKNVANPQNPLQKQITTVYLQKGHPAMATTRLIDCDSKQAGFITPATNLDHNGFPTDDIKMEPLAANDPALKAACQN
ncbi:hypothetical protein [Thalassospira sp. TSL5-1]|uniref:hypothetical protein n=1 Tax=Thalassospira sp. TSL5-1 TaxID=1544451 RepID=UPI00093E5047|nr:hypothetical protein [Thalassospira sp. TSL5-1]OKH88161.1 hypothetical protein LF95_15995 [Thalassospira sp. TSL5-1]